MALRGVCGGSELIEPEEQKQRNDTSLAVARKVVLCVGLLVATLLVLYPHWRMSVFPGDGSPSVDLGIGRGFIGSPPLPDLRSDMYLSRDNKKPVRIHLVRLVTEVAVALIFTFGLMIALRRPGPAPDQAQLVEELRDELEPPFDKALIEREPTKSKQTMKSRATRNIQIEKQTRRVLRKAAGLPKKAAKKKRGFSEDD